MFDDDKQDIIALDIIPPYEAFLADFSIVKGGLAEQLMNPLYKQFFVHSKDLRAEYVKYYSVEYPTLSDYLEICHDTVLSEEDLEKNHILKYKNTNQITDPAYERDYLERVLQHLKKMGCPNEN